LDENIIVLVDRGHGPDAGLIRAWRILGYSEGGTTHTCVRLAPAGERQPSLLDRVSGKYTTNIALSGGILFELARSATNGVTAYDLRESGHIRRIGYYTDPSDYLPQMIAPLSGGQCLMGGNRIHILAIARN